MTERVNGSDEASRFPELWQELIAADPMISTSNRFVIAFIIPFLVTANLLIYPE